MVVGSSDNAAVSAELTASQRFRTRPGGPFEATTFDKVAIDDEASVIDGKLDWMDLAYRFRPVVCRPPDPRGRVWADGPRANAFVRGSPKRVSYINQTNKQSNNTFQHEDIQRGHDHGVRGLAAPPRAARVPHMDHGPWKRVDRCVPRNPPHAHIYVSSERYLLASLATSAVGKKRGASVVYDLDPKHFRTGEDTPVTPAPDVVNRNLTSADSDSIGSVLVDECVLTRDLAHMCFEDSHGVEPLPPQLLNTASLFPLLPLLTTAATEHAPLQRDDQRYDQAISDRRRSSHRVRHTSPERGS